MPRQQSTRRESVGDAKSEESITAAKSARGVPKQKEQRGDESSGGDDEQRQRRELRQQFETEVRAASAGASRCRRIPSASPVAVDRDDREVLSTESVRKKVESYTFHTNLRF